MIPDWTAIRLELLQIDAPMRTTLREMRPFFAKSLPGILARFYDKIRHYDPACGIFKGGAMQEAIAMAREFGIGVVSVKRSTHFGMAASYAIPAAEAGFMATPIS